MSFTTRLGIAMNLFAFAATTPALADATAVARAHSEAFGRACAAGDLAAVLAMYEDDAIAIWPGQGEEAEGKAAIGRMAGGLCSGKDPAPVLKSVTARPLAKDYIVTNGRWELSVKTPDGKNAVAIIRTTEVLKETGGKWRYVVDHASVGLPPPPAAPAAP